MEGETGILYSAEGTVAAWHVVVPEDSHQGFPAKALSCSCY